MTESNSDKNQDTDLTFSVVMPAYNEQDVIEKTILELDAHLSDCGFDYEIVAVNDGSEDATESILQRLQEDLPAVRYLNNPGPGGYGFAIRKGLEDYKGDAVVIVTSDGSDAPKDVAEYFRQVSAGHDCAFGSRFMPGATVEGYPRVKLLVNRFSNFVLSLLVRQKYRDFTNGFKCYRRHVIDDMQPIVAGQFNITIELALKAVLGGWSYSVTPTDWSQRDAGSSSFNILRLIKPYATTVLYCLSLSYLRKVRR